MWQSQAPFLLKYQEKNPSGTIGELARASRCSVQAVKGQSKPARETILKMARFLGVDAVWLHDAWMAWFALK